MQYITEQQIDSITTQTGAQLRQEPKVTVTIQDNGTGNYWEGGINGHFFRIRVGEAVELPQSLATLIAENRAVLQQSEARVKPFRGAGKKL